MSGIGFWELIILFLIGLIVLGPERLPRVANQLGSWLGQARRMTRVMKRQLEEELDLDSHFKVKPPPPVKPANEQNDTYSPAHDAESAGTGVGEKNADTAEDGEESEVAEVSEEPDEAAEPETKKEAP